MEDLNRWHSCGRPDCKRRVQRYYFACGQCRHMLGYDLSVRMQTAWRERQWNNQNYEDTLAEAYRAWGWKKEAACPSTS